MTTNTSNKEKIEKDRTLLAVLILLLIVSVSLLLYLYIIYNPTFVSVEEGDCVDVNYIGRYASNNTVFDSSYKNINNKTNGTPLRIFVSLNKSALPPLNYSSYSSDYIKGLIEGLIGLKEGETTVIGPIPPEKAYGKKLKEGDRFSSNNFVIGLNITVEVTNITSDSFSVKWVNPESLNYFTAPSFAITNYDGLLTGNQADSIMILPPYHIWVNSTRITNISDDKVVIHTTPSRNDHIVDNLTFYYTDIDSFEYVFPDATVAVWNDTTITLTSNPEVGKKYNLTYNYFGSKMTNTFTIINVTDDKINVSIYNSYYNDTMYQNINRSITFNRTFILPRYYSNITGIIIDYLYLQDIQNAGYSLHHLADESLLFEVTVEKVYKTNQKK
ncbi:MAG: FKBP-type peptidyl-prolyl cis-trans isomerase [Candidatus Thermoplasmatota archaeon]